MNRKQLIILLLASSAIFILNPFLKTEDLVKALVFGISGVGLIYSIMNLFFTQKKPKNEK